MTNRFTLQVLLYKLSHLIIIIRNYYLKNKKIKAQNDEVTCPGSHSQQGMELGLSHFLIPYFILFHT